MQTTAASDSSRFGLPSGFFERHWRRQPLHLPGGAAAFLSASPSRAEISALIDGGAAHQTDGATVWFLEGLTSGLPGIGNLVAEARDWLEWHDVWCDVFLTTGRSSIGSHYDGSDNFTLQLTGNKTWFLSAPDGVHDDDRRRRVLGEPGLGAAAMPSEPAVFEVRAGDALYIPTNWIHWGFSDGDSTSVSLVINVATPAHALREQILRSLNRDRDWSSPLPIGPGSTAARTNLLHELVSRDLTEKFREDALRRVADRNGGGLSLKGRIDVSAATPPTNLAWAEGYLADIALNADEPSLDEDGVRGLVRLRAHRNLRRLLSTCSERYTQADCDDARRIYTAVASAIRELLPPALDSLLTDPELCSWLTLAERDTAMAASRRRAEDPLAEALGLIALPDLLPYLGGLGPLTLDAATDEDGQLTVRRAGIRFHLSDRPGRVSLRVTEHGFERLSTGAELDALQKISALPVTSVGTTVTSQWSDWLARVAPGTPVGLPTQCTTGQVDLVERALGPSGIVTWVLVRDRIPVKQLDQHPIPGVPRLVALDIGAPELWTRQLVATQARAEFDLVAEAFPLFDEPASRKGAENLRRHYVRTRLQQCGEHVAAPESAAPELKAARLTPWGRALLEAAAQRV